MRILASRSFIGFLVLPLTLVLSTASSSVSAFKRTSFLKMPPQAGNIVNDSTVLKELKDTIREQAKEIETLKGKLKNTLLSTKQVAAASHGGHGAGGDASPEEVADYLKEPFHKISLSRVGWLGIFLASLSMTAVIMNSFEHTLEKQIELAYFVPMLAGHGGNTGGQAVGTILSALSSGAVKAKDAPKVIMKEAMSGIMSGIILGTFVSPIAHYGMGISLHVSTVLFFTMALVSTIAATLGSAIPFFCVFFGLDPSVIAGPAMTSFVDVIGLMSYFLIANYIFGLFGLEL
jgi:cation transporter-like permease